MLTERPAVAAASVEELNALGPQSWLPEFFMAPVTILKQERMLVRAAAGLTDEDGGDPAQAAKAGKLPTVIVSSRYDCSKRHIEEVRPICFLLRFFCP